MGVKLAAASGGSIELVPTNTASAFTVTVPASTTTMVGTDATQTLTNKTIQGGAVTSGTAVASTSGTSIDFTSIPAWVKRITVMFNGVSSNGSSNFIAQLGSGSFTTSGYISYVSLCGVSAAESKQYTTGLGVDAGTGSAATTRTGLATFCLLTGNTWAQSFQMGFFNGTSPYSVQGGGSIALGGTLDRVRITTVNGTDTFDAGSVNILYEG